MNIFNNKVMRRIIFILKILLSIGIAVLTYTFSYNIKDITTENMNSLYFLLASILLALNFKKLKFNFKPLVLIFMPLISFYIVEFLSLDGGNPFTFNDAKYIFLNILLYYSLYFIIYALFNFSKISLLICNTIFYILSIINHCMIIYRGRGLFPNDIKVAKTATTIMKNFSLEITPQIIIITYIFILWTIILIRVPFKKQKITKYIIPKISMFIVSIAIIYTLAFTNFLFNIGINQHQWYGHQINGLALNFTLEGNLSRIKKPSDYSVDTIKNIASNVYTDNNSLGSNNEKPNIIVIMDESFADLRCVGNFQTNKPVMNFLDSLSENTIKGYALSSVYGGSTATSEFEFLTGCSTAFLPSSTIAYQSYINGAMDSLVKSFKNQGYSTIAFHPYYPANYDRTNTYKNLGFDKFYSNDNLNITDDDMLRWYPSDKYDFNQIIKMYEEKQDNEKLFIFNVTMQNHFDYSAGSDNFDEQISIDGFDRENYPCANRYLSLLYETDKAFENLISYFSNQSEPTIILMYGDHQGIVENDFIESLLGKKVEELSLEEKEKLYTIPFYIWANYDIEEKFINCTSINYLSTYLLDSINGVEKSDFLKFLTSIRDEIPAINNFGYLDKSNTYHSIKNNSISSTQNELLHNYQLLQYNYLFDSRHKLKDFYSVK